MLHHIPVDGGTLGAAPDDASDVFSGGSPWLRLAAAVAEVLRDALRTPTG